MSIVVGIDLGTSGCRAIALASEHPGRIIASSQTPLAPSPRHDAGGHQQAPAQWWAALRQTLQGLTRQLDPRKIAAIAIDGTSSTLLLTDASGTPLTPALMYNDTRSRAQARLIAQHAPADSPAHGATSSLAKLLYLYTQLPERERACAAHALHQADWLAGMLCGEFGVSDENNCLKLGYDPLAREWPAWLDALPFPRSLLPRVVQPGTPIGTLSPERARELGLRDAVRISAGTTDSTAAFLATGAALPGEAVTSLGSTLVLKVIAEHPINAPEFGVYSHRLGDLWLVGGASNSGGAVLLQYFTQTQLDEMSPQLQPHKSTGLDYYPLPGTGERFPVCDPDKPPRLEPRPAQDLRFYQAMLEGMARIEQQGYALLQRLGAPYPVSVRSSGGGAQNPAWREIRAAMLGVPVIEASQQQAAYGAALLALASL